MRAGKLSSVRDANHQNQREPTKRDRCMRGALRFADVNPHAVLYTRCPTRKLRQNGAIWRQS